MTGGVGRHGGYGHPGEISGPGPVGLVGCWELLIIVGPGPRQHPKQLGRLGLSERAGAGADQPLVAQRPGAGGLHPPGVVQDQLGAAIHDRAGQQRTDAQPGSLRQDRREAPGLLQRDSVGHQHQRG
jgi:hypothetical protein